MLNRPVCGQIFAQFLVLPVAAVSGAQALQCRDDLLLADLQGVRDHTRGLLEAEASVAVSAAHPLQDVDVLIIFRHVALPKAALRTRPFVS